MARLNLPLNHPELPPHARRLGKYCNGFEIPTGLITYSTQYSDGRKSGRIIDAELYVAYVRNCLQTRSTTFLQTLNDLALSLSFYERTGEIDPVDA